jgi:tRNA-dihydrouridine synthase B
VLKDINLMERLTKAVVRSTTLPVTVKTRLGWDENTKNIMHVAEMLQDIGVQALAVHGRTRVQMYKGDADWSLIAAVKNNPRIHIPIFGNGDVDSPEKALEMKNRYHVDGIMIGRAAIGNPWFFNEVKHYFKTGEKLPPPTLEQRVDVCRTHLMKSIEWKNEKLGIIEMRRHYTNYFKGLDHFKETRLKLVTTDSLEELLETISGIAERYRQVEA